DSRRGCQKMTPQAAFSWFAAFSCYPFFCAWQFARVRWFIRFFCMPANWLRTIFPALLIKNADLLIRFSRPIFRMGPTPAMRPVCWPVPATCEAVPPGTPNPMWRAPVPLVPPGDEPNRSEERRVGEGYEIRWSTYLERVKITSHSQRVRDKINKEKIEGREFYDEN